MPTLCKEIGRHCMRDSQDSAKIAFSTLGEEAPIRGAATCVIRQMFESPKTFLKESQKQSTMA
jgi:hypothetical protein